MVTYRRIATSDQNEGGTAEASSFSQSRSQLPSDDDLSLLPSRSRSERISDKLHAFAWVVSAYAVSSYTSLFHTLFLDDEQPIIRPIFNASILLFSVNIILIIYLTVYLPYRFPKLPSASSSAFWDVYCPRVIPTMTVCGVIGSFLLVRSCYPVWGFLTPLILGVVGMGMFFSLHFVPWF